MFCFCFLNAGLLVTCSCVGEFPSSKDEGQGSGHEEVGVRWVRGGRERREPFGDEISTYMGFLLCSKLLPLMMSAQKGAV